MVADMGDDTPVAWIGRDLRYSEKLATPDISIADLIGEIDPIKVAEGRHLSDESAIHYGLVPRTNRGIFCINELPDLAERIQVGLFNLMEERDVQIKGYRIRMPLDVFVVATANPEDYTNRGTHRHAAEGPLRRADSHPLPAGAGRRDRHHGAGAEPLPRRGPGGRPRVHDGNHRRGDGAGEVQQRDQPAFRRERARVHRQLRDVDQQRAAPQHPARGSVIACPRISDLPYLVASLGGKIELETFGEGREDRLVEDLTKRATLGIFGRYCNVDDLEDIVTAFDLGNAVETGSDVPSAAYASALTTSKACRRRSHPHRWRRPTARGGQASAVEFVLEGLHLNRRLNCARTPAGGYRYAR